MGHFNYPPLDGNILFRQVSAFLSGAVVNIIAGDLRGDGDQHLVIGSNRDIQVCLRCFYAAGVFTPDIHFPAHIQANTGGVERALVLVSFAQAARYVLLLRKNQCVADAQRCSRLDNTQASCLYAEVLAGTAVYQFIQYRVLEKFPPVCRLARFGLYFFLAPSRG